MSGAFLAHGYQANRIIALNTNDVTVHAMGKEAAARITLRTVDELEKLADMIPPMAYDIKKFSTLGILWKLLDIENSKSPSENEICAVEKAIYEAVQDIRDSGKVDLSNRLNSKNRQSIKVRKLINYGE